MAIDIQGECDVGFAFVRDLISAEFAARPRDGARGGGGRRGRAGRASVGGSCRCRRRAPWSPQTIACLFSASKPLAAACVLKLVERGRLELDAAVAHYWPEFAAQGKDTDDRSACARPPRGRADRRGGGPRRGVPSRRS